MMLRFPQKEYHIFHCRDKNFNIGLLQNQLPTLEDNMSVMIEIKYLARRYKRYLSSGCCLCWDRCNHEQIHPVLPEKDEISAYKKLIWTS